MAQPFFEGPEKKLELVVVDGFPSLRSFGDETWTRIVEAAGATILSKTSNDDLDAYLLSESSLFVYDSFITMITCGRSRLIDAALALLELVAPEHVAFACYERANENFPHLQETSFIDDARRLRDRVPGRAIRFGAEDEHALHLFHTDRPFAPEPRDTTLEILMHGIDPARAELFRGIEPPRAGRLVADELGFVEDFPGFTFDEHVFTPAGYSLNGLRDERYLTLHVTPERIGSYVSFETNLDFRESVESLVRTVVGRFRPVSFDIVCFVPDTHPIAVSVEGYDLRRHTREPAAGYAIDYQRFDRPSESPRPAFILDLDRAEEP
jgi:S-adenosylmethionine decarboxylase